MKEIIKKIQQANQDQILEIMQAISQWYTVSYPDWDLVYIAMPKNPKERRISMDGLVKNLEKRAAVV